MKRITTLNASILATLLCAQPALAEDIEIYQNVNTGVTAVRPNVLFILDTSGSMNDMVTTTTNYDPLKNYKALAGSCFDDDKLYYLPAGKAVKDIVCTPEYINKYYLVSQNQCVRSKVDALGIPTGLAVTGSFSTSWAQWITSGGPSAQGWRKLSTNASVNNYIECIEDYGVHGISTAATFVDSASASTPYLSATPATNSWATLDSGSRVSKIELFTGNYMNYSAIADVTTDSKINIMRDVIINTLFKVEGVNIGLMKFNHRTSVGNDGGVLKYPIIDAAATRNDLTNMKTWTARSITPLSETLYEAYRVFAGLPPVFPARPNSEAMEGTTLHTKIGTKYYKSPVDKVAASCQTQYIVLLSDGIPFNDAINATDIGLITTAIGSACAGDGWLGSTAGNYNNGRCLDDMAGWMYKTGFPATLPDGTVIPNVKVSTYGVGFVDPSVGLKAVMEPMATAGGGEYIEAENREQLTTAILAIINKIKDVNSSFTSPAVSVNAFNRSFHRSELYYTLFKPTSYQHWDGNLKRYKLQVAVNGDVSIVDARVPSMPAIDPITGFFAKASTSFWTSGADAPDGDIASKGGAASKLTSTMKVYTNVNGNNLSSVGNALTSSNVSEAQLGIAIDSAYKAKLLSWARGLDVNDSNGNADTTDAHRTMGDPLHASPALVQYGGTELLPDITAYVATNDGFLHAINTADGTEVFSFVPVELLPNLNKAYVNAPGQKLYGLDGTVNSWINDANKDGALSGSDHAYLYFGMGRGGRNVYAMDVTTRSAPTMLWTIRGGITTGFTELGHTFSAPIHSVIRVGGVEKHVVIFAGGYDMDQDNVYVRTVDDTGRAIYIVDALTGALLWRGDQNIAGLGEMKYSLPSDVAAVDVHGDDLIDRLYVGDMGGQVWRIHINNNLGRTSSDWYSVVTGARLADLAGTTAAENRRFFYAPDVALMDGDVEADYLAVLMTSGNRSHPLNKQAQDRAFMLKDRPVKSKPTSTKVITQNTTISDLYDASPNIFGVLSTANQAAKDAVRITLRNSYGWFFDFVSSKGEKGLAKPLILQGHAYFTTYTPPDTTAAPAATCGVNEGTGWLYDILVEDGTEGSTYNGQLGPNSNREARLIALPKGGIPPGGTPVVPGCDPGVNCKLPGACIVVGTTVRCPGEQLNKEKLYWFSR